MWWMHHNFSKAKLFTFGATQIVMSKCSWPPMWPCCLNTVWQLQLVSGGPAQDFSYLASFICWISFMCNICLKMEVTRRWSYVTLVMGTLSLPKMFSKLFRLPLLKGVLLCFCPILRSFVVFMKLLASLVRM